MNKQPTHGKYYEILIDNPEHAAVLKGDIVRAVAHADFVLRFAVEYTSGIQRFPGLTLGVFLQ